MKYLYILQQALIWILTIYWLYQMVISFCSLIKLKEKPKVVDKKHKFMAIIPAHNEEDVIDAHEERIQKAYPAYFDTYKDIDKVIEFINSIENLYCIGRNGQHRYNNMDHSMLTAMECVNSIIDPTKVNKETIWKVNTEQEYHEEKK